MPFLTKENLVVYIKLTARKNNAFSNNSYRNKWLKTFNLKATDIGFYSQKSIIEQHYDSTLCFSNHDSNHPKYAFFYYLDQGIGFCYYKNKVVMIDVFEKGVEKYRTPITPYKQPEQKIVRSKKKSNSLIWLQPTSTNKVFLKG